MVSPRKLLRADRAQKPFKADLSTIRKAQKVSIPSTDNKFKRGLTSKVPGSREIGSPGFDNPRENIDPTLKTQALQTQELKVGAMSYPKTDGTNTQVIQTDGSGSLSWVAAAAGGGDVTAAVNLTDETIVQGDGGAKGVKTSTATVAQIASNVSHVSGDGSDHANVALNDTHRGSDGKNHADVVLNNTHRADVTGDPHNIAADTLTFTNKTFNANGAGNSLSNIDIADLANGTDGQLITWDAAGAPTTVAVGTATHVLTSNGVGAAPTFQAAAGGGTWTAVHKTSDEIVNNSAVLQNDDDLKFAMAANTSYKFKLFMSTTLRASSDFKFNFTVPAGCSYSAQEPRKAYGTWGIMYSGSGDRTYLVTSTSNTIGLVIGEIQNGGTAGDFQLQWAQNAAIVESTTMETGSFIEYTEV